MTDEPRAQESRISKPQTITEPAREIPVFRTCDMLVVGGGPAGSAAAAAVARMWADTVLGERYGHPGGMSTGGFCLWIDRMTEHREVGGSIRREQTPKAP